MARFRGPSCKICRREGMKLFLKGEKCVSDKCVFNKRKYAPGEHRDFRRKASDYGLQLREKQKLKRIYGVLEKQFKLYFKKAKKSREVTGTAFLQFLERRLDNVIFRLTFSPSRASSRQLVRHGFVYVNSRRVDIPSYLVKEGDDIQIKSGDEEKLKRLRRQAQQLSKQREPVRWLAVDYETLAARVTATPSREDMHLPIQEQLIIELYSR